MKIRIDKTKCFGCGSCVALMPEIFEIDLTDGLAKVNDKYKELDITDEEVLNKIKTAIDSCPNGAISLE